MNYVNRDKIRTTSRNPLKSAKDVTKQKKDWAASRPRTQPKLPKWAIEMNKHGEE